MAIAMLSVGVGSKGKASPHAQYIAREGKYEKENENDSLEKLEHTGYGNMPQWAEHDPNYLWQMADENERKNGSTYREHVIALPRELNQEQRHELIKDWIKQEIGDKHAYQYAIHNPPAMDGKEQPHCHLMFSERTRDGIERDPDQYFKRYNSKNPEKGGAKKANTGLSHADRKADLLAQRERWEQTCNKHLELAGCYERISMKSLKAQGIEREPIDLTMSQLKNPEIKQAYIAELDVREQAYQAKLDIYRTLNTSPLTELNKQIREQQANEQAKQISTGLDRPVTPERHTNERGRGLQTASSVKGNELGQGHNSEVRLTDQTVTSTAPRDRRPKPQRPVAEPQPTQQEIDKARADVESYNTLLDRIEKAMKQHHQKPLQDKLDKMRTDYDTAKKPYFMKQKTWVSEQAEKRGEMQNLRRRIDILAVKNYTEPSKEHLAKNFPEVKQAYHDGKTVIHDSQRE